MRWRAILYFSFLVTIGCHKPEQPPLKLDKLVEILIDIHVAEAALQNLTAATKDTIAAHYYEQIYAIHEVHKEDFDSTFAFVKQRPKLMDQVYERVVEGLNKKQIKTKD